MDFSTDSGQNRRGHSDSSGDDALPQRKRPRQDHSIGGSNSVNSNTPTRQLSHQDYTVGWVTALHIELTAARSMLEITHPALPRIEGDPNTYTFGSIGPHNIVIGCLPSGHYGTNNAAVAANNMARTFPSLMVRLMVGIGGGVPGTDIRLGDVVVGHEVLQYDFGKTGQGGQFNCTSNPVRPPQQMLMAISGLRAEHEYNSTGTPAILSEMLRRNPNLSTYGYPHLSPDRLFDSTYDHDESKSNCDQCDHSRLVNRDPRPDQDPHIHYGTIASGNQVVKHGKSRDNWARHKNILCFEMEAAGLVDHFQCLVVRGVCDYCDSHKNKNWQKYAAATAAAYTKELLLTMESAPIPTTGPGSQAITPHTVETIQTTTMDPKPGRREEILRALEFDQMNDRHTNIKKALLKTCKWILKTNEYLSWSDPEKLKRHGGFLWIKGKPGAGKSTMMKFIADQPRQARKYQAILKFFFNARGQDLEKSTNGLYRSILLQLLEQIPALRSVLDTSRQLGTSIPNQWSNELLKELIEQAVEKLPSSVVCYIDALDECNDDQVRDMIWFFERLSLIAISTGVGLCVCFSSRHYPHISIKEGLGIEMVLEDQEKHDDDIREYVNTHLIIGTTTRAQSIKNELLEKASGVFMWAVLVVQILNKEHDQGRQHTLRRKLREIPEDLHTLFQSILSRDDTNKNEMLLCFQLILFARRPLTPLEFYFAVLSQTEEGETLTPADLDENGPKIFLVQSSRGLAEVTGIKKQTVQVIHESVKDFLLKEDGLRNLWSGLGDNFQGRSHSRLRDCCCSYLSLGISPVPFSNDRIDKVSRMSSSELETARKELTESFPFMEYAVHNVLLHADEAGSLGIPQSDFISAFAFPRWVELHNTLEKYRTRHYEFRTRLLYILAEAGTPNLIETCPSLESCIEIGPERYGCPLLAAIVNQNSNVIEVFRGSLASSLPLGILSGAENYHQDNTNLVKLRRNFEFTKSKRSLISYVVEYGDPELLFLIIQRQTFKAVPINERDWSKTILQAVKNRNYCITKLLLDTDSANPDSRDETGRTLLSWAAGFCFKEGVELLLETGATDPNSRDNTGCSPLSHAARSGQVETINLLLETGVVDPDSKDDFGRTPLSWAAENGHNEVIKFLLKTGKVDPDSTDNNGRSPFSHTAYSGQVETISLLLETGLVDPDSKDDFGRTPLSWAAENGHNEVIKFLLKTGKVDPDSTDNNGRSPFSHTAYSGQVETISLLLETGLVDPDLKDSFGRTPLSWVAEKGHNEVIKFLLKTGKVDPDSTDNNGRSPFSHTAYSGHVETISLLLETGQVDQDLKDGGLHTLRSNAVTVGSTAPGEIIHLPRTSSINPDLRDNYGRTPLSWAAESGEGAIVKILLESNQVNPDSKDNTGRTPLSWAATSLFGEAIEPLLKSNQVNPNSKDNNGRTPLSWAAGGCFSTHVETLLKYDQVNPDSKDNNSRTPLSWAATSPFGDAIKALLKSNQVNPNSKDDTGRTPLSWAAGGGFSISVETLLKYDQINPGSKDDTGRTPLSWAATSPFGDVIKALLKSNRVDPI